MGVLARALAATCLSSCYSPEARDCTVTCGGSGDCLAGQVCGDDRLCAAPAVAGHCRHGPAHDALAAAPDAPADAGGIDGRDAMPDGEDRTLLVHVKIDGKGTVIGDIGACDSGGPDGSCDLAALAGVAVTLRAIPHVDQRFDRWTTPPCADQGPTCDFTPADDVTVGVRFRKAD